ncbi:MAG: hypothetical protein ABEI99_04075 [Halobaculum sp.]
MTETDETDRSAFVELLGGAGKAKIVEAFVDHPQSRLSVADVTEIAGVSKSTFHRNRELLCELGVIERAGEVGGATLYELNRDSDLAAALGRTNYELRRLVADVEPDAWTGDDASVAELEAAESEAASVGDVHRRVGELVPKLFTEETADREAVAAELCRLAREEPSAFTEVVPALVELLDADSDVAVRVAAILEYVRRAFPDRFDFDRTDLVEAVPTAVTSGTLDSHDEWPFDENDRLNYARRSGSVL